MRTVLRKLGWFRAVIGCEVVLYGRRDCRSGVFLSSVVFHWNRGCLGREDDGGQEEKYWCSCMPLLIAGSPSGFCLLLLLVAVVASSTLPLFLPAGERLSGGGCRRLGSWRRLGSGQSGTEISPMFGCLFRPSPHVISGIVEQPLPETNNQTSINALEYSVAG